MGEAKRRKIFGLEDFRVPNGRVALTVDIQDIAPLTFVFVAEDITEAMEHIERGRPDYYTVARGLVAMLRRPQSDDLPLKKIGLMVLWTALYHPQVGPGMRRMVSLVLRERNSAHLTWTVTERGLSIAVAEKFVDLDKLLAGAPQDRIIAIGRRTWNDEKPN